MSALYYYTSYLCTHSLWLCIFSKKHHCPVHHKVIGEYKGDPFTMCLSTEYNRTFDNPIDDSSKTPRSLKLHPILLPSVPKVKLNALTMTQQDFVVPKLLPRPPNYKPEETYHEPKVSLPHQTMYTESYPLRELQRNPPAYKVVRVTLPQIVEAPPDYTTSHGDTMRHWKGAHRPPGYAEPIQEPLFAGELQKQSITQKDFSTEATRDFQPRKSFKKADETHQSGEKFDDNTTHKECYRVDNLQQHEVGSFFLKNHSKKHKETLVPLTGAFPDTTQYRQDHSSGCLNLQRKRRMIPPIQDNLRRRLYMPMDCTTVNDVCYRMWDTQPPPSTPCKMEDEYVKPSVPFLGTSHTAREFAPPPKDKLMQSYVSTNTQAAKLAQVHKNAKDMKHIHRFDERFNSTTVTKSDYAKPVTKPRERFGDRAERLYKSIPFRFDAVSENQANYICSNGKPAQCLKPAENRIANRNKLATETSYVSHYPVQPLQSQDICPAELLLQNSKFN